MSVAENSVRFFRNAARPAGGDMPKRGMSRNVGSRSPDLLRCAKVRTGCKANTNMETPSNSESGNPGSSNMHLPPFRVERKQADTPDNSREANSLDDLASQLTTTAIIELQRFVAQENPLEDPQLSSWVWLRPDGSIDIVYDTDIDSRRLKGESKNSLFLEVFKCSHDATPNSRYHDWIPDDNGEFVGDLSYKVAEMCALWDRRSPGRVINKDVEAVMHAFGFQRFSLRALSTAEIAAMIAAPEYVTQLNSKIRAWLERGYYSFTAERLTLDGLAIAVRTHGNKFAYAVGRRKLFANLAAKVKASLASRASSSKN